MCNLDEERFIAVLEDEEKRTRQELGEKLLKEIREIPSKDEEMANKSYGEQIEQLNQEVNKLYEPIMLVGDLLEALKTAAQQGLLTVEQQEALYHTLSDLVLASDFEWLSNSEENCQEIFDCLISQKAIFELKMN